MLESETLGTRRREKEKARRRDGEEAGDKNKRRIYEVS